MCDVLLPPGVNLTAVKYIYHIISYQKRCIMALSKNIRLGYQCVCCFFARLAVAFDKERGLSLLESAELSKLFGLKREEITRGGGGKLHNEEPHNL
jgi:hypothetical protein